MEMYTQANTLNKQHPRTTLAYQSHQQHFAESQNMN